MLFKKLFRTAKEYKAQFISMIIMVALGVGVFLGFNMEWKSIEKNTEKFFEETRFADYKLVSADPMGFSEENLDKGLCSIGRTKTKSGCAETDKSKLNKKRVIKLPEKVAAKRFKTE